MRPPGRAADSVMSLLLARAATPEQQARVGDQTGGRVFLFLETDDFRRDYERWRAKGVRFLEFPREEHRDGGSIRDLWQPLGLDPAGPLAAACFFPDDDSRSHHAHDAGHLNPPLALGCGGTELA